MNQWNATASTSGIWLEDSGGSGGDFLVSPAPGIGACAQYVPGSSRIQYEPSNMAFAASDRAPATTIYAHELGHALGLVHHDGWSIMNEPDVIGGGLRECRRNTSAQLSPGQ
jgi:hypothetical protein